MPTVSVLIPTHNRAGMIGRALASVLPQCRPGDEVIVVDDGSTDGTEAALAPWRDRIVYKKTARGGVGRARNLARAAARGDLFAYLDSDDEWLPGKLDLQRAFLEARPDVLFCFTDIRGVSADGVEMPSLMRLFRRLPDGFLGPPEPFSRSAPLPPGRADFDVRTGDLYPELVEDEWIQVGTLLMRRSAYDDGARSPEDVPARADWEFSARLARRGRAAYLDVETELMHHHAGPRQTKQDPLAIVDARLRILERVWGADAPFLAAHGARYRAAAAALRSRRLRLLLARGRSAEAREELARLPSPGPLERALCLLPGPLVAAAARLAGRAR